MSQRYEKIIKTPEIETLLGILQIADEEAFKHSTDVAKLVEACIEELKKRNELEWSDVECDRIIQGALLHDIGKAYLPFGLQHNSKSLNDYEYAILNMHPILGCEALLGGSNKTESAFGKIVDDIVLMHHANADGSGYPVLKNKIFDKSNVPDYVWLVAYADRFTAMTTRRSYKLAMNYADAWLELTNEIAKERLPYGFSSVFKTVIQRDSFVAIR